MNRFGKFLAAGLVAAVLAAAPALLPGGGAEAASSGNSGSSGGSGGSKITDFDRGQQHFRDGNWSEAVSYLKKAVAEDDDNAEAYNLMGYSYRRMGEADAAFAAYAKALDIDPEHRGAHEYLGETYLLVGDTEKARAQLAVLTDLCGNQCKETAKLRKAIKRYEESADKQASLVLDEENW
jgi:tetratricopeptide (TPR) repeat protein